MSDQAPLFRQQALDYYACSREKSILPRIARPPVFLFLWLLLALAGIAVILAWFGQVPISISGPGILVEHTTMQQQRILHSALALVFLPVTPGQSWRVHIGSPARIYIGTQGQALVTAVAQVEPEMLGPAEIEQRYAPASAIAAQITGPSIVVTMHLSATFATETYAGSALMAQIQVGTTSILSSVLGMTERGKSHDENVLQSHTSRAWKTAPGALAYHFLPEKGPGQAPDEHRRVWSSLPGNDPFILWTSDQCL